MRGRAWIWAATALAVLATAPATAAAECEPVMPLAEVTAGMTGTGWTVASGRTKEPFSVQVLGVMRDGISPGRDMILVEASSSAIERAGGIWAGMSGSPVYVGGRLVGALGFGFGNASGASAIGGLTPAEHLVGLATAPATAAVRGLADPPKRVVLSRALRTAVGKRAGLDGLAPPVLSQLKIPLSVSGVGARGLANVDAYAKLEGDSVVPFAGSRAPATSRAAAPPESGDNFAAVTSYGDVTLAGIGTVSYVCAGRLVAFGHPYTFGGDQPSGANAADALTVVPDERLGPHKLAAVAETLGAVDEDRLAGVRALLGNEPATVPLRSSVAVAGSAASRNGETQVVTPDQVGFIAFLHLLGNIESTYDSSGRGTAEVAWTVEGLRADGRPWSLALRNRYTSRIAMPVTSAINVGLLVDQLATNALEDVRVTGVQMNATVEPGVKLYTVRKIMVAKGNGKFRLQRSIRALPGMRLRVRAFLRPFDGGPMRTVTFRYQLPRRGIPSGSIDVVGTRSEYTEECFPEGVCFILGEFTDEEPPRTFDGLLHHMKNLQANDVLAGDLKLTGSRRPLKKRVRLDGVVVGGKRLTLRPPGGGVEEDFFDFFLRPR